jgi:hypothetical protein
MGYNINSIIEYLQIIKELQKDDLTMIYRGQADAEWDLIPSIYRGNYYIGKEKDILADIRKHNYPEFAEQDLFINELVKMQHYGIPTSLLDWTKNPLNALFFAVSDEFDKDGHVIVKQTDRIMKFNSKYYKTFSNLLKAIYCNNFSADYFDEDVKNFLIKILSNSYKYTYIDPIYGNKRIRVQDGLFSIFILLNIELFDRFEDDIIEYILKDGLRNEILKEYDKKNGRNIDAESCSSIYGEEPSGDIIPTEYRNIITTELIIEFYHFYDHRHRTDIVNEIKSRIHLDGDPAEVEDILEEFYQAIKEKITSIKNQLLDEPVSRKYFKKEIIADTLAVEQDEKFEIFIPSKMKEPILKELNELYGINSATIYPDVEGYIQYLKAKFS